MKHRSPPHPRFGEPYQEETTEAPESRSLRTAAEQGKLLPKGQILERELAAGSERRAQGGQESEYEGHCPHGSHAARTSSSPARVLANDASRCQRITVSGRTRWSDSRQQAHRLESHTQKARSRSRIVVASSGRETWR